MKLGPLDTPDLMELAARWLARKDVYQWLDFGGGRQIVTPALLKVMTQRNTHFIRMYTADDGTPIGIVALNGVDLTHGTGTLWGAAGDTGFRSRGYGTFATSRLLSLAFGQLGLRSVNTWIVEHNPSARLLQRLNFRYMGRQRQCHRIDGRIYDRLWFDLLASEHREIERSHGAAGGTRRLAATQADGRAVRRGAAAPC